MPIRRKGEIMIATPEATFSSSNQCSRRSWRRSRPHRPAKKGLRSGRYIGKRNPKRGPLHRVRLRLPTVRSLVRRARALPAAGGDCQCTGEYAAWLGDQGRTLSTVNAYLAAIAPRHSGAGHPPSTGLPSRTT